MTMKKRITKAGLQRKIKAAKEQVLFLETQNHIEAARVEQLTKDLRTAKQRVARMESIAGIDVDHLPEYDAHQITMRVDRHAWHRGGSRVMKECIFNMFAQMHAQFAADTLPDLQGIEQDASIQKFLAEWLIVTVSYPMGAHMFKHPGMEFWREVVRRFIGAVTALKEAGKDNFKVKDALMHYAYEHPIPN